MKSTDVGIPQNTMVLGKHSGKHALREKLESMGYELSDEELEGVFVRFKDLADKKKISPAATLRPWSSTVVACPRGTAVW